MSNACRTIGERTTSTDTAHEADEYPGDRSVEQVLKADYESDRYGLLQGKPPSLFGGTPENEVEVESAFEASFHGMTLPDEEKVEAGAPGCLRCEAVPLPLRGPGTVHLNVAHTHTLGKVLQFLRKTRWQHEHRRGVVSIRVAAGSLAPLLSPILRLLSPLEIRNCRALFQPEGHLTQPADYFKIEALPAFIARERSSWLLDILRGQRLRSVFQPIVRCGEVPYEIYGYECLLRGESEGREVMPTPMIEMAREADLLFQLDLAARRTAILSAAAHDIRQKLFINFTPNAIYVPQRCLQSTVRLVDEVRLKREQVVFEIVESERLPDMQQLAEIIRFYRDEGFGVALDDVGSGYSSLAVLLALRPDYIKLDMELTRNVHADAAKAIVARKLLEVARELGVEVVAEGIETREEFEWVREHGADYGQGYYFARPAAPPPLLASDTAVTSASRATPRAAKTLVEP